MSSNSTIAVQAQGVGKRYQLYNSPQDRLKQSLYRGKKNFYKDFWALRDVSFTLKRGEAMGVLGRNGAGKSTLLQILTGTLPPSEGRVDVYGRVAALLELGSGFDPDFTGRENVYLNGAILGFHRREITKRFDEIADFADIGEFMDQPVKHYSSGMFVRLAFAVQACLEPDILIVDEALAVGDVFFQQKCHQRMEQMLGRGASLLLVTHDTTSIAKYSTHALLLKNGRPLYLGHPAEAISKYYMMMSEFDPSQANASHQVEPIADSQPSSRTPPLGDSPDDTTPDPDAPPARSDWPTAEAFLALDEGRIVGGAAARVTAVGVTDREGRPRMSFAIGETATFWIEFEATRDLLTPMTGVTLLNSKNLPVHSKTSLHHLAPAPASAPAGSRVRAMHTISLDIEPGQYLLDIGLATISPQVYARLPEVGHQELIAASHAVVALLLAGSPLAVVPRSQGLAIPFAGYADLPGSCDIWLAAK